MQRSQAQQVIYKQVFVAEHSTDAVLSLGHSHQVVRATHVVESLKNGPATIDLRVYLVLSLINCRDLRLAHGVQLLVSLKIEGCERLSLE